MRGEGREESGEGSGEKRRLESGERILRAECINICKIQERFSTRLWIENFVGIDATRKNGSKLSYPLSFSVMECIFIIDSVKESDGHDIVKRFRVCLEMMVKH